MSGIDDNYLAEAERRARRFSGAFHGTSGALAGDVLRLSQEVRRLTRRQPVSRDEVLVVALAGPINAGKSLVASMLPALHLQWADPIYAGLSAMLGVPQEWLRSRANKDTAIDWLGVSPRFLLRTLGTEWGRDLVDPDLWARLTDMRIERAAASGQRAFAICGTRFPNEARLVRVRGGEVWWVNRGVSVSPTPQHRSDAMLTEADCDRVIDNTGTIDQLRTAVEAAWAQYEERRNAGMAARATEAAPNDAATSGGA